MYDLSGGKIPASETETLDEIVHTEMMRFVPTFILLSAIFVLGSIGNGLVFYIYQTRYQTSNTRLFILYLSAIDFLTCVIVVPAHTLTIPNQYRLYIAVLCKASGFFDSLVTVSTSLILISIAFERYKKVCKPLSKQISLRKVRFLCILSIVVGSLIAVQNVFIYGKRTVFLQYYDLPLIECSVDDDVIDTVWPFVGALVYVLVFLTTLISVTVMYSYTVIAIYKQAKKKSSHTSSRIQRQDWCQSYASSHERKTNADEKSSSSNVFITRILTLDRVRDVGATCQSGVTYGKKPCINQSTNLQTDAETDSTVVNGANCSNVENSATDSNNSTLKPKKSKRGNRTSHEPEIKSEAITNSGDAAAILWTKNGMQDSPSIHSTSSAHSMASQNVVEGKNVAERRARALSRHTRHPLQSACRRSITMMLSVTLTFILCYIPVIVILAARGLDKNFVNNLSNTEYILYKFFLRSYFINFTANPIIYGICDSKFRKIAKRIFSRCFAKCTRQDRRCDFA